MTLEQAFVFLQPVWHSFYEVRLTVVWGCCTQTAELENQRDLSIYHHRFIRWISIGFPTVFFMSCLPTPWMILNISKDSATAILQGTIGKALPWRMGLHPHALLPLAASSVFHWLLSRDWWGSKRPINKVLRLLTPRAYYCHSVPRGLTSASTSNLSQLCFTSYPFSMAGCAFLIGKEDSQLCWPHNREPARVSSW